jgi:phosphatidate cytidylyltransferase
VLRARIITALILLPLVLAAIYLLPLAGYAAAFWLIVAAAAWEWAALAGLEGRGIRIGYVLVLAALSLVVWWQPELRAPILLAGAAFWLCAIVGVLTYPASAGWLGSGWAGRAGLACSGWLVLLAAWTALLVVRDRAFGAHWLVWLFVLVWAADIGAYFAGRRFGRRKLAPRVSPGKTWEGVAGGAALALLVTGLLLLAADRWAPVWLAVIVVLVAISVCGDLFESVLKRHRGVKDSGAILPGHGGALDRVDSLLAALPFFALFMLWQAVPPGG